MVAKGLNKVPVLVLDPVALSTKCLRPTTVICVVFEAALSVLTFPYWLS